MPLSVEVYFGVWMIIMIDNQKRRVRGSVLISGTQDSQKGLCYGHTFTLMLMLIFPEKEG